MSSTLYISQHFDSGNIEVINASNPEHIELAIRKDSNSNFYQWFHFRVQGACETALSMHIINAAGAAFLDGWPGYRACASYDRETWFRVPTEYVNGQLVITHTPEADSIYYAYFVPFSQERHLDLLANAQLHPRCRLSTLTETVDGRALDLLTIGEPSPEKRTIWITARQHPGETMAEWLAEGLIDRLLDNDDAIARSLLDKAVIYIVPNMNPDGSARGNLRSNAAGANLNREWQNPSQQSSPEVFFTRAKMQETGVDLFLDIHGDEEIPYIFVVGAEGNPGYNERVAELELHFKAALMTLNPNFQDEHGYPKNAPGEANLSLATNWIGEHFDCLSFTLEMPFKDNIELPDAEHGWSPDRAALLGRDLLGAIWQVLPDLRD